MFFSYNRITVQFGFTIARVTTDAKALSRINVDVDVLKFDWPKTARVREKACLTGKRDRHLAVSYLQP